MKKLLIVGVFVIGSALSFHTNAYAQEELTEGDISVGAGISYGTDIEEIGIQANGTYVLKPNMRLGADFIYWLTESNDYYSYTALEFNANFHYIFHNQDGFMAYGIGSLGIHYAKVDSDYDAGEFGDYSYSASDSELGLGIGVGGEYNLGAASIFAEPRFFLSGFDQFELTAGVRFGI